MDYKDGYFAVCADSICGYMNDFWIKKDDKINEFIETKETEEKELNAKKKKAEYAELQKEYIKKYGQKTYNKLRKGDYWIGMTTAMAGISLGSPKKVNSTVGSWGDHEQWVYDNFNLYFEDGITDLLSKLKTRYMAKATKKQALGRGLSALLKEEKFNKEIIKLEAENDRLFKLVEKLTDALIDRK